MSDVKTAEGLGGCNISPDDPRVRSEPPSGNQPRPSDPDWVERRDPENLPKYLPGAAEGVAFDPGNMSLTSMGGGAAEGRGGGASTTARMTAGYQVGAGGSMETRGVRGTDTQAASSDESAKSSAEREQAGRNQDPASVPEGAPGLQGKTNWKQS